MVNLFGFSFFGRFINFFMLWFFWGEVDEKTWATFHEKDYQTYICPEAVFERAND